MGTRSYVITAKSLAFLKSYGRENCGSCGKKLKAGERIWVRSSTGKYRGWWPKCEKCAKKLNVA